MEKAWRNMAIIICLAIFVLWRMNPGSGQFMPVPIVHAAAPEWSMPQLDGTTLYSTNLLGRVVVVNFWATWCPPCVAEIPALQAFHTAHTNEGLTVVGASIETNALETIKGFVKRNGVTYPVGVADTNLMASFAAYGPIPTTYIIDRQGQFAARYLGSLSRDELERVTAPLLTSSAPPVPAVASGAGDSKPAK